ncbi:uncharacterized protein HKW66_Vig0043110 [Vigna angularis]|uniref:Uncharacterized protein n=2 Tax=Phaseolus angularis TaxID=3914 RepID=A0A8T0KZ89_PHAAN|nr:uncharacterized protein HKW66_Vig0043110 [Vigna angularis]BAT84591.1 hypothetical protein VIGAN_04200700 [Vigna angularis var. angularis]
MASVATSMNESGSSDLLLAVMEENVATVGKGLSLVTKEEKNVGERSGGDNGGDNVVAHGSDQGGIFMKKMNSEPNGRKILECRGSNLEGNP